MLTVPQASCFDNFKITMKKYFKFEGRARRSEFWFFKLFVSIIILIYFFIVSIIFAIKNKDMNEKEKEEFNIMDSTPVWIIYIVINVIFLIPNITVSVRRLHDVNRSGYFYLLNLIPFIGSLILLYFYLQDSFPDSNEYGPSTKYILPVNDFSRKNPLINNNEKEMQEIP